MTDATNLIHRLQTADKTSQCVHEDERALFIEAAEMLAQQVAHIAELEARQAFSPAVEAQSRDWLGELRRAHEYLDQGKPFFSGKDCAELADFIEARLENGAPTLAQDVSDDEIEALKKAAIAATPQDIDGAQRIDRYTDGSEVECSACGGEGTVLLEADFCNYDGVALGVQFYGIGHAHGLAEAYFRAARPATILALIERLARAEANA